MSRVSFTPRERTEMFDAQGGVCFCGCGQPLGTNFIAEHWTPVALGNLDKPDCLLTRDCARRKTNGLRGDLNTIAHVKRLRDQRTQHDRRNERGPLLHSNQKLQGRGFDKTLSKKLSGEVIRNG